MANHSLDGSDSRMKKNPGQYALDRGHEETKDGFTIEKSHVHNDPDVQFEAYLHYVSIIRAEEQAYEDNMISRKSPWSLGGIIKNSFSNQEQFLERSRPRVTALEWRQASRALRTTSWGTILFLITTNILDPSGAANWAFSNTDYGPGVALHMVFGLMASISEWYVWGVYMHTDSHQ
ncbi:hypothetical protein BJ878DRAFT_565309 [Calycina marina]|uniref:Uncharacterized protein n=1 Tax=Calycina marina TaxID=1763456 RepID=A0A9P8CIZ5_9HELO|nr:hypothetical protein BJ878DRAFT_565309 [Calycina marina]